VITESGAPDSASDLPITRVWPVRQAVALVLAVAALTIVASRVLRAMPGSGLGAAGASLAILGTFVVLYGFELGIVWLVAKRSGMAFGESVGMRVVPQMGRWLGVAAASGFGLRLVATAYAGFLLSMGWRIPGWDSNPAKYFPRGAVGSAVLVFIIVIAAPIVEETIFRGVLLPSLASRLGQPWGVGITVVVFAALHLNPFSFAPILLVGWALAALFLRSRSLWVSIACHSVFNGIGVLVLLALRGNGVV
jgi:membrane protease YdiL (CAAX protease family)